MAAPANRICVLDHGADSGGVRDSADAFDTAWAAALVAAPHHGGSARIAIPAGAYRLSRTPDWQTPPDRPMQVAIEGDGDAVTALYCGGTGPGLRIVHTAPEQNLRLRGLTLVPDCPFGAGGPAIEIAAPDTQVTLGQTALIEDITVAAVAPVFAPDATAFPRTFLGGLRLATLWNARLANIRVNGAVMQTRVVLIATEDSHHPDLVHVRTTAGLQTGMSVSGDALAALSTVVGLDATTLRLSPPTRRPVRAGEGIILSTTRPILGSYGVQLANRCIANVLSEVSIAYVDRAFWQTGYVESPILKSCTVNECITGWYTDTAAIGPAAAVNGRYGLAIELDSSADWYCLDAAFDLTEISGVRIRHSHLGIRNGGAGYAAVRLTDCDTARIDACDFDAPHGAVGLHLRQRRGGCNFAIVSACRFQSDTPVLCDPGTYANAVTDAMWIGKGGVASASPMLDRDGRNLCTWFAGYGPSAEPGVTGTAIGLGLHGLPGAATPAGSGRVWLEGGTLRQG